MSWIKEMFDESVDDIKLYRRVKKELKQGHIIMPNEPYDRLCNRIRNIRRTSIVLTSLLISITSLVISLCKLFAD